MSSHLPFQMVFGITKMPTNTTENTSAYGQPGGESAAKAGCEASSGAAAPATMAAPAGGCATLAALPAAGTKAADTQQAAARASSVAARTGEAPRAIVSMCQATIERVRSVSGTRF